MVKNIGVLALQGDFFDHIKILKKLNVNPVEVRTKDALDSVDALIIPGGESTTIGKLLKKYKLDREIKLRFKKGMPIYGTCAGAIVLAKEILNYETQPRLGLVDISIDRNAYGRQIDSFETPLKIKGMKKKFNAIFIRAPIIKKIGKEIEVLAKHENKSVLIRNSHALISTFHPEMTEDRRVHGLFLNMVN